MKKILAVVLAAVGTIVGTVATSGCILLMFDEPEMPETLE